MPVLVLLARSTAVADTDLEAVRPTIAHGVPGCTGGFIVVSAAVAPSAVASPCGKVRDVGKEPGNLGAARCGGGIEGSVGDGKPLNGAVILYGGVCEVVERNNHCVAHLHLCVLGRHAVVGNASEPDELTFFKKGPALHRFPTYPGLLVVGKPHPTAPCIIHATGRYGVLGTCVNHGGLDDG